MRQQSPRRVIRYYYSYNLLSFVFDLLVFAGLWWMSTHFHWPMWIMLLLSLLLVIDLLWRCIRPWLLWKYRFYQVNQHDLTAYKTFFFKKEEIVKFDRIQYVARKSGPLMRLFKLYKIDIVTAGHEMTLPILNRTDAMELEKICAVKLMEVDSDV